MINSKSQLPSAFNPELRNDRLAAVARWLLEELYATEDDLNRSTDNGYTRGCTTFGRQRNRIIAEALSNKYPWLTLSNSANDLVFQISGVPCRFSNDDPTNPSKDAVLYANRAQLDFFEEADKGEPARFCFVIDRGFGDDADPGVVFLGFSASGSIVCEWVSDAIRVFHVADMEQPPPAQIPKPRLAPKSPTLSGDEREADGTHGKET